MTLYALYPGGRIAKLETDGKEANRHLQLGAIIERWLPRSTLRPVRLLWHVQGSANLRAVVLAPTIATSSQIGAIEHDHECDLCRVCRRVHGVAAV